MGLGHWAVIDIETTGIHPQDDEIIDLGYYQFEGTTLIKKFSSLVRPSHPISPFITKLTGITDEMARKAPMWETVLPDLLELEGHALLAHNAGFEEKFLQRYFDKIASHSPERETFEDSILYLGLLFPWMPALNLEGFIQRFGFADKEEHRGEADSRDLLKVVLTATWMTWQDREWRFKLTEAMERMQDFWWKKFFYLSNDEIVQLSRDLDFDVKAAAKVWLDSVTEDPRQALPDEPVFARSPRRFNSEEIQRVLRDEEAIQTVYPHYRYRHSQEQMGLRVGQALKNEVHALIQAPTGTGKTLAYLLPSTLFSLETQQPVLIATGTKALQEQVVVKDVPQLRALFHLAEDQLKVVRLVGSSNHLCELIHVEAEREGLLAFDFGENYSRAYFDMLFFHNTRSSYAYKATREQIPFILKKLVPGLSEKESELAVDYRACVGSMCPFVNSCSYLQGLREAKEANLIVGNHALLLNWPRSFPRPEHVIVDEAHKIESEATKAFAVEITKQSLDALLKIAPQGTGALLYLLSVREEGPHAEEAWAKIREESQTAVRHARDQAQELPTLFEALFKKSPNYHPAHGNELPFPQADKVQDPLAATLLHKSQSLAYIWGELYGLLFPYFERMQRKDLINEPQQMKAFAIFESFFGQLEKHTMGFRHLLENPPKWCSTLRFKEDEGWAMESAPIDVGDWLSRELLAKSKAVVYTSATLANATGDTGVQGVEWMTGYRYVDTTKRFKQGLFLPPVFDYRKRAKVFLCPDGKNLSDPMFVPELMEQVYPLVEALEGRTLFLFSSRVRFELAVDLLLRKFEGKIAVYAQGMGKSVVEDFKKSGHGILVGMESFGEGIDIPGEQLQLIVIDKIPDVRQEIVIQQRRDFYQSAFGNEFQDYFLAHRARSLHQKCGRLLRRETDFGGILILDNRIKRWKGPTLKSFAKLMEPYQLEVKNLSEAATEMEKFLLTDRAALGDL